MSPKWAELFVTQMAGDEMSLPRNAFLISWSRNLKFFKISTETMTEASTFLREQDVSAKSFRQKKIRDVSAIFFCRNVRRHVFAETSFAETSGIHIKYPSDMSPFSLVPCGPLGPLIFPSC